MLRDFWLAGNRDEHVQPVPAATMATWRRRKLDAQSSADCSGAVPIRVLDAPKMAPVDEGRGL